MWSNLSCCRYRVAAKWGKHLQSISFKKLATFIDLWYWQVIKFDFEHDYELSTEWVLSKQKNKRRVCVSRAQIKS